MSGTVGRGVGELSGGLHGEGLVRAVERPRGQVDVRLRDGLLHLVDADAERGQLARIELDAHRVLLRAEDLDLRHAADHRDALGEHGLRVLVHRVEGQGGRAQRHVEDGLVRRD